MKHTIEELGEHADEHHEGGFAIWQVRTINRGNLSPNGKPWGCQLDLDGGKHYGSTPDEAVDSALSAHDRANNPDRENL